MTDRFSSLPLQRAGSISITHPIKSHITASKKKFEEANTFHTESDLLVQMEMIDKYDAESRTERKNLNKLGSIILQEKLIKTQKKIYENLSFQFKDIYTSMLHLSE